MKFSSGIRIAGLALLAVGVLLIPASAQAHKKTYSTTVTAAAQNKNQIDGRVLSSKAKCLPLRTVRLYSPAGVLEGSGVTDSQGAFKIAGKDLPVGVHRVAVTKRVIRKSRRHTHRCAAAETTLTVA